MPAAWALARARVGHLTLIDLEAVELSNLARQVIYRDADLGTPKVEAAARRLHESFPGTMIDPRRVELDSSNARAIVAAHDFIIDATDNPVAKFLINDACVAEHRSFVYGGVLATTGQAMSVVPASTPCLRCLFEEPPDEAESASCREAGIVGPIAGAIGEVQAAEAIRVLRGEPPHLAGVMLTYDATNIPRIRLTPVDARPRCGCGAYHPGAGASAAHGVPHE